MPFDERYINNKMNFEILKCYFKFYFVVLHCNVSENNDVLPSKTLMNIICEK